jgi:serine/threonine-protein kinase
MSPEQVAGRPVDQRSDIFSLGTVLYELLTDTKLFAGNDATEIMYNVSQLRPAPLSRINRKVPAMLDLVVAKALEKDANERYQDAHQFAADLRACLNDLGVHRVDGETTQRIDRTTGADSANNDKTEKLTSADLNAAMPAVDVDHRTRGAKPQNIIVDANTRLAISQIFDSSRALARLTEPEKKDYARLVASPRPSNFLVQIWRDLEMRILIGVILAAALAGIIIAAF